MRYYGKRPKLPQGTPEDLTHCIAEIWSRGVVRQCSFPRGERNLCRKHAKDDPEELVIPPDDGA